MERYKVIKESWSYGSNYHGGGDPASLLVGGFPWPPRSYTCSFCKREFRSAQALGGHMNVHRRDRARLRQLSPPWDPPPTCNPKPSYTPDLNLNPSYKACCPSPDDHSTSTTHPPFPTHNNNNNISPPNCCHSRANFSTNTSPIPNLNLAPPMTFTFPTLLPPVTHISLLSSNKTFRSAKGFDVEENVSSSYSLVKEREAMRLDLEIGVCGNPREDLDLELRLGCS